MSDETDAHEEPSRGRLGQPTLPAVPAPFHPAVAEWFRRSFPAPTRAQTLGWPAIARGESTLIFAPTGSGKTLAAFLWCLERLMFAPQPPKERRCRVVYMSPLKARAVDVERNLRAPLAGIANLASERGEAFTVPTIAIRTGDTPSSERSRFLRDPTDILITTPESIYLMLTSNVRELLRGVDTVIIDEIHALVPNKRGAHLALSLERLDAITHQRPNRIGLSATQRPLSLVAEFLGGNKVERCHSERSEESQRSFDLERTSELSNQQSILPSADSSAFSGPMAPSNTSSTPVTVVVPSNRPLDLAIELSATEVGPSASNV